MQQVLPSFVHEKYLAGVKVQFRVSPLGLLHKGYFSEVAVISMLFMRPYNNKMGEKGLSRWLGAGAHAI